MAHIKTPAYQRSRFVAAGDNYGIGEPPKVGKLRSSYTQPIIPMKKKVVSKPPRSIK